MNKNLKKYLTLLGQYTLFWTIAMSLLGIYRYYGIENEQGIEIKNNYKEQYNIIQTVFMFALSGLFLGIIYASIDFLYEKIVPGRIGIGLKLILKNAIYFISTVAVFTLIIEIASYIFQLEINNEVGWWHKDKTFWAVVLYIITSSMVFSFIIIANEKFGRGVFIKMLMGKYREPQEEERIFMFLDLKSSTTIAEQLGHFKYSKFIQDCFYDLNEIVTKYDTEIYQYVGDEAILSWPYKKGFSNNNCIELFFTFQQKLLTKKQYYKDKYNVVPEFKAGLHGGKLMVAEVGVIKKELAYHGDVMNTSARIQAECNKYGVSILISQILLDNLKTTESYSTKFLGEVLLKGKLNKTNIYTIDKL